MNHCELKANFDEKWEVFLEWEEYEEIRTIKEMEEYCNTKCKLQMCTRKYLWDLLTHNESVK